MSATDNAFIRAYTERKQNRPPQAAVEAHPAALASQSCVTVGPLRVDALDPEWIAAPHFLASAWTPNSGGTPPLAPVAPPRPASTTVPDPNPTPAAQAASGPRVYSFRPDPPHTRPAPSPHTAPGLFAQAVAGTTAVHSAHESGGLPPTGDAPHHTLPKQSRPPAVPSPSAAQQVARVIQAVDRVATAARPIDRSQGTAGPRPPAANDAAPHELWDDERYLAETVQDDLFLDDAAPDDAAALECETSTASDREQPTIPLSAGRRSPLAAGALTVPWKPQWEIDEFTWTPVCLELSRLSAEAFGQCVRSLRDRFTAGQNIIAVTSAEPGEGVSTIALCLAYIAAQLPLRVAIMDGNLHQPSLGQTLGAGDSISWHDLPWGGDMGEAAVLEVASHLCLIPARSALPRPTAERSAATLDSVADNFELVVLDAGPLTTAAHEWFSTSLVTRMNGLVVRDVRRTPAQRPDDIFRQLTEAGLAQMAVVENYRTAGGR